MRCLPASSSSACASGGPASAEATVKGGLPARLISVSACRPTMADSVSDHGRQPRRPCWSCQEDKSWRWLFEQFHQILSRRDAKNGRRLRCGFIRAIRRSSRLRRRRGCKARPDARRRSTTPRAVCARSHGPRAAAAAAARDFLYLGQLRQRNSVRARAKY
jgi:hypothetical protein